MLWANAQSGAQLALFNGGALRDSLPSTAYVPTTAGLRRPGNSPAPWDIVQGDIAAALALNNAEVVISVTGAQLWAVRASTASTRDALSAVCLSQCAWLRAQALENGVSTLSSFDGSAAPSDGRFPQIAGFQFTYSYLRPAGSRVLRCVRALMPACLPANLLPCAAVSPSAAAAAHSRTARTRVWPSRASTWW